MEFTGNAGKVAVALLELGSGNSTAAPQQLPKPRATSRASGAVEHGHSHRATSEGAGIAVRRALPDAAASWVGLNHEQPSIFPVIET